MKINTIAVLLKYYNGELNPFDQAALECALLTASLWLTCLPTPVL